MPLKTALKAILRFWIEVWMTHIYYYGHHLYEHGLYFKFPDHEHPARITIRTPLLHKFVDSWGYIFGLCSLMFYFIDHERSLDHIPWFNILRGFMPPVGARSLLIPVMVWSFTRFIYVYFGLSNNLMKYRFMSAMMAKDTDNANIHFSDIGLSQKQYNRLAKYRRRSFVLFVWIFVVFVWLSCSSRFGQAIKHKVHEQNLPATLFWMWIYYNWISMTASFIYAPALCFLNASFVIWMKQRAIREEMNDLAYRIERRLYRPSQVPKNAAEVRLRGYRRFLQLMHQNEIIYHEILTYDQLIGPCLTVLFACYTAIVAFAFYFIIMRALPIFFKLAYWFLFLTHIVMLAMLTFGCGRIASKGLGRKVRHFLEIAGPFYHPCHRLHFQTIASSLLYTKVGFTLLDYRKVKSSTFFTISTYVSTLFFLVFRKAS